MHGLSHCARLEQPSAERFLRPYSGSGEGTMCTPLRSGATNRADDFAAATAGKT
jgi:hypothetical protein